MTSHTSHSQLIADTAEAAERLAKAVVTGAASQWDRPLNATGSSEGRAVGGVSNPTMDIATDERRLALRAAVIDGELTLERFVSTAHKKAEVLEAAHSAWAGPRA